VLALSANVMAEDLARYKAAGMNGAVTKPIDWPKLFDALAQHGSPGRAGSMPPAKAASLPAGPVEASDACEAEIPSPADLARFDRTPERDAIETNSKLAELFVRDAGKCLEELRDAIQRTDLPTIARLAHAIKGSAANLGAQRLAQLCADIETRAKAAELEACSACLDGLQREFARTCAALAAGHIPG
jgi:HPt (histidine-containing phosphotransfer) domain-containing protein